MKKVTIHLRREAMAHAANPEKVRKAAQAAYEASGGGDIHIVPFIAEGRQYALSSRIIIEVDWLPNRLPKRVIRPPKKADKTCRSRW